MGGCRRCSVGHKCKIYPKHLQMMLDKNYSSPVIFSFIFSIESYDSNDVSPKRLHDRCMRLTKKCRYNLGS